jgi:hypothetical protein
MAIVVGLPAVWNAAASLAAGVDDHIGRHRHDFHAVLLSRFKANAAVLFIAAVL